MYGAKMDWCARSGRPIVTVIDYQTAHDMKGIRNLFACCVMNRLVFMTQRFFCRAGEIIFVSLTEKKILNKVVS